MFIIIVVSVMSLAMWALGALAIANGLDSDNDNLFQIVLSFPILPWIKDLRKKEQSWGHYVMLALFFYTMSILGIICIFNI